MCVMQSAAPELEPQNPKHCAADRSCSGWIAEDVANTAQLLITFGARRGQQVYSHPYHFLFDKRFLKATRAHCLTVF